LLICFEFEAKFPITHKLDQHLVIGLSAAKPESSLRRKPRGVPAVPEGRLLDRHWASNSMG
jgi:hypothetical protein